LPPYIKTKNNEDTIRSRYQSIFAKQESSIAAPTASLHFTPSVFQSLSEKSIEQALITLHIGLGTFAPITDVQIDNKKLHTEVYMIPKETSHKISLAKKEGRPVVAVGTTVVRALESKPDQVLMGKDAIESETSIFIKKPYHFNIPDVLITNFHVPKSSLLMLVDAFLADKGAKRNIIDLYKVAIENKFRFFSFGDAMLIK
jgi:S-adenosylmethionine:tRNA ribosyltransferase-isomerase